MNDFITDFEKRLNTIDYLSTISIEFGLFKEDAIKPVTIKIINLDDTQSVTNMDLGDVMYLTEHGTLTIPARPILDRCIYYISTNLEEEVERIIEGVLDFNWSKEIIHNKLNDFCIKMELFIRNKIDEIVVTNAGLSNLLNVEDENKYLYDLKELKKYIKCKIIFSESRRN